jgi:replicative DNA helicase
MLDRVRYQIRNPDHVIEELILLGMITQTEFLQRVVPRIDLEFFRSPDIRTIIYWILNYYEAHNKAPGSEIETICQVETRHDKTLQREKLENLLSLTLDQLDDSFNTEYVLRKALEYFKRRSLAIVTENVQHFLGKDNIEEAELAYYKYREVVQAIQQNPNPLGNEALRSWWEHTDKEMLRFPGYLGKYLSPICRSQLVGVLGPPKRGKTTILTEFACVGLMHKLKVVFFSLEMTLDKINQRIVTRLAGRPKITEKHKEFILPVMDCELNQTGKCRRSYRKSGIDLLDDDDTIMPYNSNMDGRYKPCSVCLGKSDGYKFAPWYETRRFSKTPMKYFENVLKDFRGIFGDNLRVEAYPTGKLDIRDLENRLTLLEQEENFIPDIVVVDAADNLKKQDKDRRIEIGRIWEQLVALGQERNCLVVTASQTNRAAVNKPDLTMEDLAEDFSKAMVADMFLALNQTSQEKDKQIFRLSIILHRHRGFSLHHQCRILQAPEIGQFCLGSCAAQRKLSR